uniref:Uncharacterized protein n=1 Tax=Colobus angolensis palliatus TaxID=336983 RepID=A0A2K5ITN8_COLAP
MSNQVVCLEVSHAGSWYSASGPQLNAQLEGWLSQVQSTKRPARAIIALHAGCTYCGSCATHAYKQVDPSITQRIFILGPSHHVSLSQCALSSVDIYRTSLYHLHIDQKIYRELWKTGMFERMFLRQNTNIPCKSVRMSLPLSLLISSVVPSDFCHWGQRFRYSYYDKSHRETYRSIEYLDKMGMSIIEQLDPISFSNYLRKYHIIICGRHPFGVLLNNMSFLCLNYVQSNQCRNWQDGSVTYAAGTLTVH